MVFVRFFIAKRAVATSVVPISENNAVLWPVSASPAPDTAEASVTVTVPVAQRLALLSEQTL